MTPVSELLALKIENLALKLQQLQLQGQQISEQQQALLEQARAEVKAPEGHQFHVDTRTFQPPNGPRPLSAPAKRQLRRVKASV